jgi:hypothetical protein
MLVALAAHSALATSHVVAFFFIVAFYASVMAATVATITIIAIIVVVVIVSTLLSWRWDGCSCVALLRSSLSLETNASKIKLIVACGLRIARFPCAQRCELVSSSLPRAINGLVTLLTCHSCIESGRSLLRPAPKI